MDSPQDPNIHHSEKSSVTSASKTETRQIRQQRKWFEVTLASIGDGVITADEDGKVTMLNPIAESLTGWQNADATGQPLEKVFHIVNEDTRAEVENPALRAIKEGVIFGLANHTLLITKDGKEISIDDSGAPIKSGGEMLGAVLVFRDITARRRAEQARALLASIVDSSEDAIISKSLAGIITSWNNSAERMFGYTPEEAIGKSITIVIPAELREEETMILSRLRQGERIEHFETIRLTKSGKRINISLTVSPVRNKLGEIIGASARLLASERAARERAEAASRAKDEFVAMISHEIRSPLNAILGWSQMLRQGALDKTATTNALESIERNARAQAQLVSDLLDVSRVITGKLRINARPVDIMDSLESALESVHPAAEAKQIILDVQTEPYATVVTGDADRLQQVLWNLLSNAVKFTPRQGRVSVKITRIDSYLEVAVSDSGIGIPQEFLPFIFDRFSQADTTSTRKHAGLGLGLAIARHIIELHGGTITAESAGEGKGSTFRITLPVRAIHQQAADSQQPSVSIDAIANEIMLNGLRVMVVDDETETRELLNVMLSSHGAEVLVTSSGTEALAQIDEWQPAIIVSDIGMPVMDGYMFIKRVRELDSDQGNVPAIALTAYARADDRLRALAAGFQMHVPKPVEASELVMVIASLAKRF
ncbi:MAG: hybrid sensor histidine kinase/response regulator [Acidobacteria bacterium]|nr:MAG: hybrid sensor histidine kinase/response regulator [Acidobacteriota bacterium]